MKALNEYPLYRLLIPMILGIIVASFFYDIYISIGVLIILFLLFTFWVFRFPVLRQYSLRFVSGIFIVILFFLFGYQLLWVKTDIHASQHYSRNDSVSHFLVSINSPFIEKEKTYKTLGKVIAVYENGSDTAKTSSGKILLYFSKQDFPTLSYGDELIIVNKLQPIKNYGNPNEFDYVAYLKQQNIYHRVYLMPKDWIKTPHRSANEIMRLSYHIREVLLAILIDFDLPDHEFAVASAILLGYDDYLDRDLRQLYAGSGAMHILCVSGLHVGIIFLMFNVLLAFIKRYKYGILIHAVIIILIIWLYALITGLSPSVFRSATMFSFMSIGMMMNRKSSTYNSLAASAFVLLIYNPYLLFHIGFQLSYMAVLSILLLQPLLSKLFYHPWWLFRKTRDLIAVSVAAQVGTFPLAIYYFHQFPNYFILTNLLVIPLSFIIIIAGFANILVYLIGSGSSYIGIILSKSLYGSLWFLNHALAIINELPMAVSKDLYFSQIDTFLIYLIILFIILSLLYRSYRFIIYTFISFIVLFSYNAWLRIQSKQQEQLLVYHVPQHSLMEIQYKNTAYIFADSSLIADTAGIHKFTAKHHLKNRIKQQYLLPINSLNKLSNHAFSAANNFVMIADKSLFLIDHECLLPEDFKTHQIDYVLLRDNPKISMDEILASINFDTLIIDASNKYWNIQNWKRQCDSLHIAYWDIKERGAFVLSPYINDQHKNTLFKMN